MTARVLVVLPTLGERIPTLCEAVASVVEQGPLVRLVVVSSSEDVRVIAAEAGATLIEDPRSGLAAAMNAGLAARGDEEFYVGIGDDDLLRPGAVKHLVALADARPDAAVIYGACDYIDADNRVIGTSRAGVWASRILAWGPNLIPHPGALIRLDPLVAGGGFDVTLPYTMDLDAFLRLKAVGRLVPTSRVVSAFRWHPGSLTVAGRRRSAREAMTVKRRRLRQPARALAPLWLVPVAVATEYAGRVVDWRARRLPAASRAERGRSG